MTELTEDEYWFLLMWSYHLGIRNPQGITELVFFMLRLSAPSPEPVVEALVAKRVLERSPDRRKVKFTDHGLEVFRATERAQKAWDEQPVARISTADRDQILVKAGETFRANRVLREIFGRPQNSLCVIDPYIGPTFFDLLEDARPRLPTRVITSSNAKPNALVAYHSYRKQYGSIDMRIVDSAIHDRYILWDGQHALHIGHSLKDLGTKDTQINRVTDAAPLLRMFEERWAQGKTP
jgi:hypothetical protein